MQPTRLPMTAAYIQLLLHRKLTRCSSCHPAHRANKTACHNRRPPQTHCTGARYTLDNCPRVTELGHKCVGRRRSLRAKTPERQLISHSNQKISEGEEERPCSIEVQLHSLWPVPQPRVPTQLRICCRTKQTTIQSVHTSTYRLTAMPGR